MKRFSQKDIDDVTHRIAYSETLQAGAQRRRELMMARSALNRCGQYPATYDQAVKTALQVGYPPDKKTTWTEALGRLMKCPPHIVRQHIATQETDEKRAPEAPPINVDKMLAESGIEIPCIDFCDHMPDE